jgi:hypothetical protein
MISNNLCVLISSAILLLVKGVVEESPLNVVPNVVHQIYDYQSPNFFFYLSLLSVQTFLRPKQHILYVNDEGRYRKGHWDSWLSRARESSTSHTQSKTRIESNVTMLNIHNPSVVDYTSFLTHFASLIDSKAIDVRMLTFPAYPFGNTTHYAANKAHRSDFLRMEVLRDRGGIYLDTDVFIHPSTSKFVVTNLALTGDGKRTSTYRLFENDSHPLHALRQHPFTIAFDNIVNIDDYTPNIMKNTQVAPSKDVELTSQLEISTLPKRMNNGVLLSSPNNSFLSLWAEEYKHAYHPNSFDYDSSVTPFKLATLYPDLVHVEMNRLSPISFGFQTSRLAEALTCGIFIERLADYPHLQNRFPKLKFEKVSM